jgi:sporulation protein YlmC with PRC-barrel domain
LHLRENAAVVTSRGRKMGRIHRVIVDPASGEATYLVVKIGPARFKIVPAGQINTVTEQQVLLNKSAANPVDFPDFR